MFTGVCTALVTPFRNDKIDEKAFAQLIEYQIKNNVSAVSPCGTTGESPTLSNDEHKEIIKLCVDIVNKRVKVIAGTGSNSTVEAIGMTEYAKKVGADAVLSVVPYYNKPNQEGLYNHFKIISDSVDIPTILYNVPGRTVTNLADETIARLANLKNIIGIKDATGDLARVVNLRMNLASCLSKTAEFMLLSGEDATMVGFNAMGGCGVVSVAANIAPSLCSELQKETLNGNYEKALKIQDKLYPLFKNLFIETNPVPVKYALYKMGMITEEIRLPLINASDETKAIIDSVLKALDLV